MSWFLYSNKYFPPAPIVEVRLGKSKQQPVTSFLEAMIDTGADGTFVPLAVLEAIGVSQIDGAKIRSQWGEPRNIGVFEVSMQVSQYTLASVEVIGDDSGDEVIIGRNILNRMSLLLDGIGNTTQIKEVV